MVRSKVQGSRVVLVAEVVAQRNQVIHQLVHAAARAKANERHCAPGVAEIHSPRYWAVVRVVGLK